MANLVFSIEPIQVGDAVLLSITTSDQTGLLSSRVLLPSNLARQFANTVLDGAAAAEKKLIVPVSAIASA